MRKLGHEARTNLWGYVFVAPFILVFLFFGFWPIVNTFLISATDHRGLMALEYNFVSECTSCRGSGQIEENCLTCQGRGSVSVVCPHCSGTGDTGGSGVFSSCFHCLASGTYNERCLSCAGSGRIAGTITTCSACNGSGQVNNFVRNLRRLINDNFFWGALRNTFIIWGFNFIPQLGIALIFAVWLSDPSLNLIGKGLFRAVIFMPNLLTAASVAFLFRSIFGWGAHVNAPANQFLRLLDIYNQVYINGELFREAFNFFRSVPFTRGLVSFIQWWMWYGHSLILIMAGITSIPVSLFESAIVDGANRRQITTRITLPLLRPIMLFLLITSMIGGMQMFDIPFLLTDGTGLGSPDFSIRTTVVYQYHMAFRIADQGYGAMISVGIFSVTLILALIIFFFMQDRSDLSRRRGGVRGVK